MNCKEKGNTILRWCRWPVLKRAECGEEEERHQEGKLGVTSALLFSKGPSFWAKRILSITGKGRGFLQECWEANFPNYSQPQSPKASPESVYIELYFSRPMEFQNLGKGEAITSSVLICSNLFSARPWIILHFRDLGKWAALSQSYYGQELKCKSELSPPPPRSYKYLAFKIHSVSTIGLTHIHLQPLQRQHYQALKM